MLKILQARLQQYVNRELPDVQAGFQKGRVTRDQMTNICWIMQNAGLDEAQAGIKIAKRSTNNLRYADDTTFMAKGEEELKNLLMKVKEESEKVSLKLNIQRRKLQFTPVFLPGESQGRGSLVGCHLWGPAESNMTEVT